MGFILLRLIAMFGHHGSHHIPRRVRDNIYIPPTYVICLPALQDNTL